MTAFDKSQIDNLPIHQLVKTVLGEQRIAVVTPLDEHIAKHPSVFELIKLGPEKLQALGLSREEAQTLLARGRALALYITRLYRQQELRAAPKPGDEKAQVPLPTYQRLFTPNADAAAPAGSPEHRASTTAYMVALYEWIRDYIKQQGNEDAIPLEERRPDVNQLQIDEAAINQVKSRGDIHSRVLETQILSHVSDEFSTVKGYLRSIRFPHTMPYDHDRVSIRHVVRQVVKNGSLGEIIRRLDRTYPYFKNPGGRGPRDDVAHQQSIGSGPGTLALLLEPPYFSSGAETAGAPLWRVDPRTRRVDPDPKKSDGDFYRANYGSLVNFKQDLQRLWIFKQATGRDQDEVDCLLGRGRFTPKLSANAPMLGNPDVPLTGVAAGACYIHGGDGPAIGIEEGSIDTYVLLTNIGEAPFPRLEHRADRINRKSRLDRILGLPSHKVDRLLIAAMNAERRGGGDAAIWIRPGTLSCLGLFVELSTAYGCTAEEFAGFIDVLSAYGQDGVPAFFDLVYNHTQPFDAPLRIDGHAFAIIPVTPADQQTVHQICTGLAINFETYRYLATVIVEAYGQETHLVCDLDTLSSFWRLVRLARMFGLTPIESTALLQTLGLVAQLAGRPVVSAYGSTDGADALSAIHALMTCAQWASDFDLPVLWLVQNVNPVYVPTVWTETQEQFLLQLHSQAPSVLVEAAKVLEAGAPLRNSNEQLIDWMTLLAPLVDEAGLVIGRYDETEDQYLARTVAVIDDISESVYPDIGGEAPAEREPLQILLRTILLRCRDEQQVLVEEGLSVYLRLDSLLTAQVLAWAQGHPYEFLKEALAMRPSRARRIPRGLEEPVLFLKTFAEVERRARIADRLKLSPAMLETLLEGEQYEWFSLKDRYEISIHSVYYLALFSRLVDRARQPEEKMLDYLRQVNLLPDDLSDDARRLIRDAAADKLATFFGCGIRHVLTCVEHVTLGIEGSDGSVLPFLRTLEHLDVLVRTLELASKGMDAEAAVSLAGLNPLDGDEEYAQAAQNALESLARFNDANTPADSAEVGQSFTTHCVVDNPKLIAGVDQEVAEFLITLLDFFGIPLVGVILYIKTDLGVVLTPEVRTDSQGRAWVQLQAGARSGTAHVSYNLPLHEARYAPSVVIGPDEATLRVNTELSSLLPRDPVLAGKLQEVEVDAVLIDDYGNRGVNRPVQWATTNGEIRPSHTVTDKDGVSRVWISSRFPGDAKVSVGNVEGTHRYTFNGAIKFTDKPRILGNSSVNPVAMVGQVLSLSCKVVGLDDEPVADEKVLWWTSADATKVEGISNVEGVSEFSISAPAAGALTIFAQLGTDPVVEVMVWVASAAVIQNYSEIIRFPVAGAQRPTLLWLDVKEAEESLATPVGNYPVKWAVNSVPPVEEIINTDAQGRSVYPFTSMRTGQFTVTATLDLDPTQTQAFDLNVIPAFEWLVNLITIDARGGETRQPFDPAIDTLTLLRDGHYRLEVQPKDATQLEGTQGAMGWSCTYSTQALGMVFTPSLATRFHFDDAPYSVDIRTGNVRNGDFQLSVYADRLERALVLQGTLRKRPVTRRTSPKS
ncbi:virulence plasmid 28 protein [Pseudomonas sp. GM18]|uniref:Tc toxin subunit A n=1 Tax=Pseudomonas sp. GM18 TaxID=1144324 RepID=UPI0002722A98|nr:Tc toxin subunit A [Pseudomonas sp. GM18]EJM16118.1 virulence plasmid 28 protein [Pseudomonas sp. GM18]